MNLENLVIRTATIITIICFFTGLEICYKIWKKRSTKDISPVPFIFGFINTTLWLYYGMLTNNDTITNTNGFGFAIFLIYNLYYYLMCANRHTINKQYLVVIISLFLLWNLPNYFREPVKITGLLASSFNIAFFASPLIQIRVVFKTKSAESLPFLLILVSFISSCLWFYYGLIIDDVFIKVPNLLAIFILSLQLALYFVYYRKPTGHLESAASSKNGQALRCKGFVQIRKKRSAMNSINLNGNDLNGTTNGNGTSQNRYENEWVKLCVGGSYYQTTKSTLCRFPDSFLARLCHDNNALKSQRDGEDAILIDRDGEYFSVVLNFLRHGNIILNKNLCEEGVLEEAEFYGLSELVKMVEKRIQARQQQEKKAKPVYRFIQCCENEIVSVISGLSDGWRFEQLLMNNPNPNTGAASEFYCVVSSDSANYCGTISHKAKQIQQSAYR